MKGYVLQAQNGTYYARDLRLGYRLYVPELELAHHFSHYVDAFNARVLGDRVLTLS